VTAASHGWDADDKSTEQRRSELSCRLDRVVGGLELSVKFAHSDDRERVIETARGVGWASVHDVEHRDWLDAGMLQSVVRIDLMSVLVSVKYLYSATSRRSNLRRWRVSD